MDEYKYIKIIKWKLAAGQVTVFRWLTGLLDLFFYQSFRDCFVAHWKLHSVDIMVSSPWIKTLIVLVW